MEQKIDLSGVWSFQLDPEKKCHLQPFQDTIRLPGSTSYYKKGKRNEKAETGCLTDEYAFEGYAWFSREIEIFDDLSDKNCFLFLERTRVTTLWLDDEKLGTQNSLCTPHIYDLTGRLGKGKHIILLCVDNLDYPTKGGHMTSPDTQTNWNGVTGLMELRIFPKAYLDDVQLYPNAAARTVTVKAELKGAANAVLSLSAENFIGGQSHHPVPPMEFSVKPGPICVCYPLGEDALLWSEHDPNLYRLNLSLSSGTESDNMEFLFGLRDFQAVNGKFTINGEEVFLRGKHDGMIFPLTGFAPTTPEAWMERFRIAKEYGINHYRFHTCCPPDGAFQAADLLGIYLEPELPFWGTVPEKDKLSDEHIYLAAEGLRILKTFGNHPSFVMMSLGNELWGSKESLNELLGKYKAFDNRHLYTQGSNNFQFNPAILENDDFFCGVRFSRDRLIRGSYAMCDAPLGHVQTGTPGTLKDYDDPIHPSESSRKASNQTSSGQLQIQYGTGTKTVEVEAGQNELLPTVPVVSHEIGQYCVYPDFREIEKYKGPLKARNFEIFRKRLEEKSLGSLAEKYFYCSGKLAANCYREELEAAFRSENLAGFQLLDLQDYTGQGTALVGMLNAFMESKGLITSEEWRSFCSDAVLLARFEKYIYEPNEEFHARVQLRYYRKEPLHGLDLDWAIREEKNVLSSGRLNAQDAGGHFPELGAISLRMPVVPVLKKIVLSLSIKSLDLEKQYNLWVCPANTQVSTDGVNLFDCPSEKLFQLLRDGQNAVIFAKPDALRNSVEGTYCTDFWCYPMFRSISESMGKAVPVGTMGLLIQNGHPVFRDFPCEQYATEPWRGIVSSSRALILDDTPQEFRPIVQVIDNFERNHKLGLLFECHVLNGNLIVCTADLSKISGIPEGKQFLFSIFNYIRSKDFRPSVSLTVSCVKKLFQK